MKRTTAWTVLLILLFASLGGSASLRAQVAEVDCAACHTGSGGQPAEVSPETLKGSLHEGLSCLDCHTDITELPHPEQLAPANCAGCHAEEIDSYKQHGRAMLGQSTQVPTCGDCHGSHQILAGSDNHSSVSPVNLPATCGKCHEDSTLITDLNIKFKHPIRVYSRSVHGRAMSGGIHTAASCNDCHSTGGNAHHILPPGDISSTINFFNIPKTCGKCHTGISQDYAEGVHGRLVARGEVDAPTCTHCHGEHGILPVSDPRSPVSPYRVAEATCTPCHESAFLNEKYDLPSGRLQSFRDSYHGLKSRAGDKLVANCGSCHGAHRILPSSDATSSIAPANLQHTCGQCHPGITDKIAATSIHSTATGHDRGWPHFVKIVYVILIVVVIGGMIVHWLIDLFRQIAAVLQEKQVRRMDADEVVQHTVLALAFTVLVVTGFALRYYDAWWSTLVFGREGGYTTRGIIHRSAGVVLLLGGLWHLIFLVTTRGRRFLRDMLPGKLDVTQFFQMMKYNLGRHAQHPHFGRFSYVEKAEYWALVWGTVVMGITGLFLWFDNYAVKFFPKGLLDVLLVIHYYEAWLAFLAILIWHMYATVFNPKVYPMNPSWINGMMPERQLKSEHPLEWEELTGRKIEDEKH
jgi:formate dehydrogenase gamma subunit